MSGWAAGDPLGVRQVADLGEVALEGWSAMH
jgi:hypothetical protein